MSKEKGFFAEFKKFIMRGNVIDLAVGVIIGGAFQAIVSSLVDDIVTPLLGIILGKVDFSSLAVKIGEATINYGKFITAIINFFIMALVIFAIIKVINDVSERLRKKPEEEEPAPTTKVCPYCKSEIDIEAVKCPHCTSDVE
ncbi:MAG: large conductance mechanosensitive channel protein MscL [Acutalibacteraceae bacterium]|nr:large conductance mechanosensitive channel protein MscL [Clostridiaceae bacterium]MDD6703132.1 large conductance mechanosensitive channel protein MscL [Clostridiaceae bacterium]MEE1246080.1 large conductance mechanosensitive channel protein MscL [Acutalibacteraceae bacterium]